MPLLELLLDLCGTAAGPDWHLLWAGPQGTRGLPKLAVWQLLSPYMMGTGPVGSSGGPVPAFMTAATLKELLQRGLVDVDERAPSGGTGAAQLLDGSTLLLKVIRVALHDARRGQGGSGGAHPPWLAGT